LCWNRAFEFQQEKLGALIYSENYTSVRREIAFSELKASNEEVIRKQLSRNHYHNNKNPIVSNNSIVPVSITK